MKRFLSLLCIGTVFGLSGCGLAPSKKAESRHVFRYAKDKLREMEQAGYSDQAVGKAMALYQKVPYIIFAKQNQSIRFVQQPVRPRADSLIYSLGNGHYRLSRGIYLTALGQNNMLSFDGERWFSVTGKSAAESGITGTSGTETGPDRRNNLEFRLHFTVTEETALRLTVDYQAELVLAPRPGYDDRPSKVLSRRPVRRGRRGDFMLLRGRQIGQSQKDQGSRLTLETGGKLYDELMSLPDGTALELEKSVVFYPEGFEFYYRLYLLGNILQAVTEGPVTEAQFLRDVHFYYPNRFFASISFDGTDWSHNYFQFRLESFGNSVFLGADSLQYADGMYLYRKGGLPPPAIGR
ncbi:hypothetical protein P0082_06770 [Candidatus Haliotispira prima]|uniref:Uncharacterized protein n=1 Tax=Candidatus Haliotispira prima TaxID=3034016 RepID=A0ABY8MG72_9SPIO|nr:hypothetical protein P0082_06770 [Candidatus Haliotispira prima]